MAKFISIFNNKGGVGKTTLTWNLADALAEKGKRILLIDFDPQCNLSIAMLGADEFKSLVSDTESSKTCVLSCRDTSRTPDPGR
jgi:chromosome partitioning protein